MLIILVIEWSQGKELFNDKIVPMLAMIYLVFFSTNMITYFGLSSLQTFLAILDRLASVFAMEENQVTRDTKCSPEDVSITVKDGTFSWGFRIKETQAGAARGKTLIETEQKPVISEVNFSLKKDDLLVVVGMVGCGKTTLLHSLMEETRKVSGEIDIKGTVAFVEQEPFIVSASIKENILLGKSFNQELFDQAIAASQLGKDIE